MTSEASYVTDASDALQPFTARLVGLNQFVIGLTALPVGAKL